jgi:hypothetical protein
MYVVSRAAIFFVLSDMHLTVWGGFVQFKQGITKRCRLSWLTISALVYEPKGQGDEGVARSQPMSTAVHIEPK